MSICFECGQPGAVDHHVVPVVLGGTKTVPLCESCHKKVHAPESALALGVLIRGRHPKRGPHKVKADTAKEIILLRAQGVPTKELAARFSISRVHVYYILKGRTRVSNAVLAGKL